MGRARRPTRITTRSRQVGPADSVRRRRNSPGSVLRRSGAWAALWLALALLCFLCPASADTTPQEATGDETPAATQEENQPAPTEQPETPPVGPSPGQETSPAQQVPLPGLETGPPTAGQAPPIPLGGDPFSDQAPPAVQFPFAGPDGTPPGAPAAAPKKKKPKSGIARFLEQNDLFQGVTITGQNTLTFQQNDVEGSKTTYESQRWDTDSVVRRSSLHLEGPVWKELVFEADISDSGWGQRYSRWVAGYVGHDSALLYGDLDLQLGGNEFVAFRKSTKGWQFDQKLPGNGFARGFYTREKGLVRNQTFVGNDTAGPYFLTYTPVIEGSEVIKVNEEFLEFGTDYRLDYDTGQLYFEPVDGQPRIITAADTVSVSYQSLGYNNQGPGQLYGFRAEVPVLKDRMLVGVTTLQQDRQGGSSVYDTVGYQEDVYNGSGSTGPFDTNYRPIIVDGTSVVYKGERQIIDKALTVLVDSVEQLEGVDYDAFRTIGRVIFRRAVPPTSLVIIKYFYDIDTGATATGDQQLWGVDLTYTINDNMNWSLDWAQSSGVTDDQDGNALSTMLSYNTKGGAVRLVGEYRSVDPTFAYIDTVGFRRREKGINFGAEWDVNEHISVTNRYSKLDSDSGLSFGYSGYSGGYNFNTFSAADTSQTTSTAHTVATERNELNVRLDYEGWPNLTYQRSSMSNNGANTGDSDYTTDSINLSYNPRGKNYSIQSRLSTTKQRSFRPASGTTTESTLTGSDSDQFQTSVSYNPSDKLSFSASYSENSSSAVETVNNSTSDNVQLTARWNPNSKVSVDLTHSESSSSGRVTSGFYGSTFSAAATTQINNPGGGGGGGDDDDDDEEETERPGITDRNDRLSISWRPSQRLSLDLAFGMRDYSSTGSQGYLADSTQDFWNFGAMWQVSEALSLNLALSKDDLQFLEEDRGAVLNRSYVLSASYRPPGTNWSAGLTLNIQDGSSPTFVGYGRLQRSRMVATKLTDISGQLSYQLSDDLSLVASGSISDYAGGYSDFKKHTGEVGLRYRLSNTVGVDFGYRFIKHVSRTTEDDLIFGTSGSGQNYIANTFLLNLNTSFRGGVGSSGPGRSVGGRAGVGYSGGPGTFGGYSPSLYTGSSTGYTGYSPTGAGAFSGFGTGTTNRYGTGYGPSTFDTLGQTSTRQTMTDLFGATPFGAGGYTAPSGSGKSIKKGIGEFRDTGTGGGAFDQAFNPETGRPEPGPGRPLPGGALPGTALDEDWWLLEDNMAYW